jgi:hypothetical protein
MLKELSEQGGGRLCRSAPRLALALTDQVQGSAESGRILTPPPKATADLKALERDDGLLTAF